MKTKVYILGTNHEHKFSAKSICYMFKYYLPDILAIEDNLDYKLQQNHEQSIEVIKRNEGDVKKIIKHESIEILKKTFLLPGDDGFEKIQKLLLSLGHLNNVDSIIPYYLTKLKNIRVKRIDVCNQVFNDKLECYDSSLWKIDFIKLIYGLDCYDRNNSILNIDIMLDLLEACTLIPMIDFLELAKQLEIFYRPKQWILETHIRDLYMVGRIQSLCIGNPGKIILVLTGADHTIGIRKYFYRRIPKSLMQCINNPQQNRKQLWKMLRKYQFNDRENLEVDPKKLSKIGIKK